MNLVRTKQIKKLIRSFILYMSASLIVLFAIVPILWMIKTSFETTEFIRSAQIQFWPIEFTLDHYRSVLNNPNALIFRSTLNSLIVSTLATLLNLIITTFAAYAISRFDFVGKKIFGFYLLLLYMIPGTLVLIGMFVLLAKLNLINTYTGLVLVYSIGGIPLSVWWLKGYFDTIPVEIEEQAMIDGCTRTGAMARIVVPLALPGVTSVGLFQFVGSWNEFMLALTIIQTDVKQLLPVRIINFMGFQRVDWGPTMAFSVMVAIPAIFLFIGAQRQMISGLMSGFTK